jgi:iron complex outermembrane recepter protein
MNSHYFARRPGLKAAIALLSFTYSLPIFAQASIDAVLEEVTITAQKRTERLSDVTVSASVVAADTLSNANAGDIADLNNLVPSVNFNATINGRVPIGVRGISSNANEATVGLASGVAVMIDGVPVPSDSFAGNQLEDVKSVEVLKGPQITLGGRTASAGVINIVTRGPSDVFTGTGSITATNDNEYRVNGFIAGPISDAMQYSLSAYDSSREYPIINLRTGKNTDQKNFGVRGKLLFKAGDVLDITVSAGYQESESRGFNFVYEYLTPGSQLFIGAGPNFGPVASPGPPFTGQAVLLPGITPGWGNRHYSSPVDDAGQKNQDSDISLVLNYQIGDLTLGSTTAYQRETSKQIQDLFAVDQYAFTLLTGGGLPFDNRQRLNLTSSQLSEELKLVSPTDRDFSYVVGLFYSDAKVDLQHKRGLVPALTNYTVTPDTKTYDIYGRSTWKFLPTTSLVTGLRYNMDKLNYVFDQIDYQIDPFPVFPSAGAHYSSGSDTSSALVGDLSLQQHFSDDVMGYVTFARGYAPRVYNTSLGIASNAEQQPVGQMHINHFEIGSKGTYLNRRLRVNASLFDTVYNNYQLQSYSAIAGAISPPLILSSVGKAETRGAELDVQIAASDSLVLNASLALIDAKFKDYKNAPCWGGVEQPSGPAGTPAENWNQTGVPISQQRLVDPSCYLDTGTGQFIQDVSGKTMPNSPKVKGTLGFEKDWALAGGGIRFNFGGSYSYRSKAQMLPDQNPQAIQDAFGLINAHIGVASATDSWSVNVFGNNLTNHHYAGDVEDFWTGPWGSNAVIMQPARDSYRYYGVKLSARF